MTKKDPVVFFFCRLGILSQVCTIDTNGSNAVHLQYVFEQGDNQQLTKPDYQETAMTLPPPRLSEVPLPGTNILPRERVLVNGCFANLKR